MPSIEKKRHSLTHIMAQAVKDLYGPEVKLAIGPDIDTGFYYDMDFGDIEIGEADLKKIEKKMKQIIKQNQLFTYYELPFKQAREFLANAGEDYKVEMADDLHAKGVDEIGFYKNTMQDGRETFVDMCEGPHVDQTSQIDANAFKLDKIAGAYWRGDASKKMLTRIYGFAFDTPDELQAHLTMLAEAKKRDHRVLGKRLKLFTLSELVGSGLPLMQPKGMIIRKAIEEYIWDLHKKRGYDRIWTPHLAREDLYKVSGHAGHYLDDMFSVHGGTSKEDFFLKPMNCPHHMQIFADNTFSYRDMPVRYFEPATVYRDEKTGELSGLTRVRSITQDDGHLFCRISQIKQEVSTIVEVIKEFYTTMGLIENYWVSLSVRDEENKQNYLGTDEVWEEAQTALEQSAKENGLPYKKIEGEAAFYGPKLDFMFKDAIGREWQLATIQCDFNLPERFQLSFTNESGEEERPVVIHRAISGSLERFMGLVIEHFAGAFPLWMSPNQVDIIPVAHQFEAYAKEIFKELDNLDFYVDLDDGSDSFNKKIRNGEQSKYNYILIIGEQEQNDQTVSVRNVRTKEQYTLPKDEFITHIVEERKNKSL